MIRVAGSGSGPAQGVLSERAPRGAIAMGHALDLPQLPSQMRRRHIRFSMSSAVMHCFTKPEMVTPASDVMLTWRMMALISSTSGSLDAEAGLAAVGVTGLGATVAGSFLAAAGLAKANKADDVARTDSAV